MDRQSVMECLTAGQRVQFNYCHQIEHLVTVIQNLSLAHDLNGIMQIVKVAARQLTASDGATFILKEKGNCYYAEEDAIAPLWKGKRFPLDICIGGWTMRNRCSAIIPNIFGDERIPYEAYQPTFVKSLLTAPIRQLDPIGAIGIYWSVYHEPTDEEIKLLQALADSTAIAMENVQVYHELEQRVVQRTLELQEEIERRKQAEAEIRHLSLTDELTQLYNRRGFFFLGERELETAMRNNYGCTLFFIDLDGLKQVNDNYGHEIGDQMIKDTALILQKSFREIDIIARLGGDEFVVLTKDDQGDSQKLNRRLHNNLANFNQNSSQYYQLSFSIGIVPFDQQLHPSLDHLLKQGDEAMYEVKKRRKHR